MRRLTSIAALGDLRAALAARPSPGVELRVCSTGCRARGALQVCDALEHEIEARGLADRARVARVGCHGLCAGAVVVIAHPMGYLYQCVTPEDAAEIVETTVLRGDPVERLCWQSEERAVPYRADIHFYRHQRTLVLRNCGAIDPRSIEAALLGGAYTALARVLSSMSPEGVIDAITEAGLRGRGGAGFPTGRKWRLTRTAQGEPKYIICNADEGDPGAFMDRALLEGDPHLILEGMMIGAYAIGATRGVVYVRAEYPIAVEHTELAVAHAREFGLLGEDILGSGMTFDIEVRQGAGAFVCGEETALIASTEGRRGMPRPRPPFPAQAGLYGKPTNINNVETLANIPRIIEMGAAAYAAIGTEGSKGTKIFALAGKVNTTGLVEAPMGATLREIIFDIGNGVFRDRRFKAAQMGGPSGGCVPAAYLDLPIDYDSLRGLGAIMGSGGLIVMDEATCMVDIARFFTRFVVSESCGKCAPCRIGTRRMLEILTRITEGEGVLSDIDQLETLGKTLCQASLCGLGQTAANPVLSTIRFFRHEYEAHILEKRCPANACEALVTTTCSSACPARVNVPEYIALISEGRFAQALDVIRRRNPFASVCGRACDHPCETFCRRGDLDAPVAIRHLKRFASDQEVEAPRPPLWQGPKGGRVAIIGSGPAGLSAAYFLALMGREATVFEALDVPGGILAVGIPEYRLPREALQRDIDYIKAAGVTIETGRRIDSLSELRADGYHAIFVAVGAHRAAPLDVPGEDLPGVWDALEFLRGVCLRNITELRWALAVVVGGNAAIDAARTAVRLGAESVTLLYRRTRAEMPAIRAEIEEAQHEGVAMRFLVAPIAIEGNGRAEAVRCVEMELGAADESGRRRPMPKPGSEQRIPAAHVIVAIGQRPHLDFAEDDGGLVVSMGRIHADRVTQRSGEGEVFAGGDAVTGPATIVEAVAAGQRAATAIDRFLGGSGELPPDGRGTARRMRPPEDESELPRQTPEAADPAQRRASFAEVMNGYSIVQACAEARRCLRCDLDD